MQNNFSLLLSPVPVIWCIKYIIIFYFMLFDDFFSIPLYEWNRLRFLYGFFAHAICFARIKCSPRSVRFSSPLVSFTFSL